MNKKIFISFDYDNDKDIKGCLSYQLLNLSKKISVDDASLLYPFEERWKKNIRSIIGDCDLVIFLCGKNTKKAKGVTAEMTITQELNKKYILLRGRKSISVTKPKHSCADDEIIDWTRENLLKIITKK